MFSQLTFYLFVLPFIESSVYLYNTHENVSVEFYDCIIGTNLSYCRRPSRPILVQRDQSIWSCYHDGIPHSFSSLIDDNVSVSTILHQWSSSMEMVEEYSRYKKQRQSNEIVNSEEKYLCECQHPQSFGKHCEYLLPMGTTFQETVTWEVEMRRNNKWDMHMYSDIVCYTTLTCDYGLLCLDWRDICDGLQHCMYGYDEENCDKLEFNECEDDEYRCMNGMCIPDEYFLDGEYDCLDLTDEIVQFDDTKCTFEEASYGCDDRMCLRSYWSCGDGQCTKDRFEFLTYGIDWVCNSIREQYHMCELNYAWMRWTLPNGKCYQCSDYEEIVVKNRTDSEECIYLLKCHLSNGLEKNCPCKYPDSICADQMKIVCPSTTIWYPNGGIIAPYAFTYYHIKEDWDDEMPDGIEIDGTIKCRGYMTHQRITIEDLSEFRFNTLETVLCTSGLNASLVEKIGYDEFCYNDSRTFNDRSYNFIDICSQSKECISAYRINDGYDDCVDQEDDRGNDQFANSCSNIQHHRFRCSDEQPTCFPISKLGDKTMNCRNNYDEQLMGRGIILSELACSTEYKNDCEFFHQYIVALGKTNGNDSTDARQLELLKIPFRSFCDTFWNWDSRKDEIVEMCYRWWRCLTTQWQCRSGQCVEIAWVLDEDWDCIDASDEQAVFFPSHNFTLRNFNIIDVVNLTERFDKLYHKQPFWKLCNLNMEYPCYRANVSHHMNITFHRPCISLLQIGDGHIDCAGGMDERNTLKHCSLPDMLGYHFQCSASETCMPYSSHCLAKCDDNRAQCNGHTPGFHDWSRNNFICLDGEHISRSWCNGRFECSHGEDRLFCSRRMGYYEIPSDEPYRAGKELSVRTTKQKIQLPQLPTDANGHKMTYPTISMPQIEPPLDCFLRQLNSSISYYCNRGIGVYSYNESIVCFCPPQYYGDKCQFHNDRITVLFHLNLSQSIYAESNNPKTMLTLLIIFVNNNQIVMTESFQVRIMDEIIVPHKKLLHLFYSRSNASLQHKQSRYLNRSNIIDEQPYSVRIEAYELSPSNKPRLVGVWLYPIYFDFLPSFRLAKVFHLTKLDPINNPCSSNPCSPQQECHRVLNQNLTYVCLCQPNFKGENCSIRDKMCEEGFCSSNALCKPTYRGLLSSNEQPYCLCSLNEMGHRCNLIHDRCYPNPCQNDGTCFSTPESNRFLCVCDDYHYGDECQLKKRGVQLYVKKSPSYRAAIVQYFDINFISLDLLLIHQRLYTDSPDVFHYLYNRKKAPDIVVVKLYSETQSEIYLISIQNEMQSINGTTELNERNRCAHVQTLFPTNEEISPYKYHYLCNQNPSLLCFVDQWYLCICEENHNRTECFGYDHSLNQCSFCLSGGKCLKENRLRSNFLCLCPRCHYGSLCQFSIEGIGFTVDSLIVQIKDDIRIVYLILAILIFATGGATNYASIITFKRSTLLKSSIAIYMLTLSLLSQYSLFSLIMKILLILLNSLMSDVSCKIISFLHSISIRCSFWLTSWIAIERVSYVLFPFSTVLKKRHVAVLLTFSTLIIVGVMHIHEMIFYMKIVDPNGQSACVVNFPLQLQLYDRITVLVHYLIPFSIQIFSITILIILAARSRSRSNNHRDTMIEYIKRQFQSQKELYIPPLIIVLSSLPQIILSFSFACLQLVRWQQHALLLAYFLSFAPQLLGFILFVLPSTNYTKEFQATKLSQTILFRWIISKKKEQRKI